jgi:hypothetical protein
LAAAILAVVAPVSSVSDTAVLDKTRWHRGIRALVGIAYRASCLCLEGRYTVTVSGRAGTQNPGNGGYGLLRK